MACFQIIALHFNALSAGFLGTVSDLLTNVEEERERIMLLEVGLVYHANLHDKTLSISPIG